MSKINNIIDFQKYHQKRILNFNPALFFIFLLLCFSKSAFSNTPLNEIRQMIQLAEYIGVDYTEAVKNGTVASDEEYLEMVEFSSLLVEKSHKYSETSPEFKAIFQYANSLKLAIELKGDYPDIQNLSLKIHSILLTLMPATSLPIQLLPKSNVKALYQETCSNCHGPSGGGNGQMAKNLTPAPTDFTDKTRALNRSVLGLYESISNGISDTSMPPFKQLKEEEIWSLAFYVGSLAFKSVEKPSNSTNLTEISLAQLTYQTPNQLNSTFPKVYHSNVEYLRGNPSYLFDVESTPFSITREKLKGALNAYALNDYQMASNLTVSAYLDGFELIENSIDAQDNELRKRIEANMMLLRQLSKTSDNEKKFKETHDNTLQLLDEAEYLIYESKISNVTLFSSSLIILLREGLEALLVVLALTTVLIKTSRKDAIKYVHIGWISALFAGVGTWLLAQSFISISGANREIMEGFAALLAATVLFYVGVWMHSKTHADNWQAYIKNNVDNKLKSGTLWGLTGLAFIAVYREVFETVLFYQALLTQAVVNQHSMIFGGFITGVIVLVIVSWVLIRYSVKLPISTFFSITTYLLLALSFILTGKAIMALQEAAVIGISPLPVTFEIDWVGIKSTWQGVLAQSSVLLLFIIFMLTSRGKKLKQLAKD